MQAEDSWGPELWAEWPHNDEEPVREDEERCLECGLPVEALNYHTIVCPGCGHRAPKG